MTFTAPAIMMIEFKLNALKPIEWMLRDYITIDKLSSQSHRYIRDEIIVTHSAHQRCGLYFPSRIY